MQQSQHLELIPGKYLTKEKRGSPLSTRWHFTFASLATFLAVSSATPLMPIAIPITASLFTGAILTTALTLPRTTPHCISTDYEPTPLHHHRVSYYRPSFHYVLPHIPRFHHRPCYPLPRRDCVGERGPTVVHCRPIHSPSYRPVRTTTTHHHVSFACPDVRINRRRDVVGGRPPF